MSEDQYSGHLSDSRDPRLRIGCAQCHRQGDYSVATLRKLYGNPPMSELPRLVAIRGDCPQALRYPGADCRARFISKNAPVVEYLVSAHYAGWQLILTCERNHQALKSVKPCPKAFTIDMFSLLASLGHDFPIDQLDRKLICPGCGSHHHSLHWIKPDAPRATEPVPIRSAG